MAVKCVRCGNSKVNFRYSETDEKGVATEYLFCMSCATIVAPDVVNMFIDDVLPMEQRVKRAMTPPMMPRAAPKQKENTRCECPRCSGEKKEKPKVKVDEALRKHRELNAKMEAAKAIEDYEEAARIRDEIKTLL